MERTPQTDTQIEQLLKDLTREDLAAGNLPEFSRYCWQDDPEHVANAPFHDEIYWILMHKGPEGEAFLKTKRLHLEAPREHAKTTMMIKYALWRIGWNHNIRVILVSKTATLATDILREVRTNIESNQHYRKVFPEVIADKPWGDEAFQVKRTRIMKTPTFYGVGLGGSITGLRGDLVILDDPFDLNEVQTPGQRKKIVDYIESIVIPIVVPNGEIICVGTRWHKDDYWGRLLSQSTEKGGRWVTKIYQAIQEDQKTVLWPERWPLYRLKERQQDIGTIRFNMLYQNDVSGFEGALFKESWLHYYNPKIFLPGYVKRLLFYMAVDPAISESPEADQTAITTIAVDPQTTDIYVLDMWADRIDFPKQVKKIDEFAKRRKLPFIPGISRILKVGVESTAYQRALSQTLYLRNLPIVEVKHARRSKLERMLGLQPNFENGRIKFPDPEEIRVGWMDGFMEEYLSYPQGKHEDRLDSLEITVEIAKTSPGVSSMGMWMGRGPVG